MGTNQNNRTLSSTFSSKRKHTLGWQIPEEVKSTRMNKARIFNFLKNITCLKKMAETEETEKQNTEFRNEMTNLKIKLRKSSRS